jgi:hypothetical protein
MSSEASLTAQQSHPLLVDEAPGLAAELKRLLEQAGEEELVNEVQKLAIFERVDHAHGVDFYTALLQSVLRAHGSLRRPHQAVSNSSRALTNWTTSASAETPRPKARSTMRASPQMSFVMLKVDACPLRSARITSKGIVTLTGNAWQKSDGKLGELGHTVFLAHVS